MMEKLNGSIYHTPVMVDEVLSFVNERKRSVVVDCTVGDGGHSEAILATHRTPSFSVLILMTKL